MSFLDLYPEQDARESKFQPNEGTRLPSGFDENLHAAWSDGQLFSQSISRANARAAVLHDYVDEIRAKTGNDLSKEFIPDVAGGGQTGVTDFTQANDRVAKLKADHPDLDLDPMSEDEIDKRAVAKAQAAHRTYQTLQQGEKTWGGSFGSFLGSAGSAVADPTNVLALAVAPETAGIGILSSALRWGALAGVSQAAIEFQSDQFKEQVQPGYTESGEPLKEIAGAFVGGAVLGGGIKALGNAWTRVKTGQWPTSVRDAGNVIESEANVAQTNIFPGAEGEVAHREALVKTIDDILAGRPVDVEKQITPELQAHFDAYHGSPHDFETFDASKIGTGEGAQAYGHGLYFAESSSVADTYRPLAAQGKGGGTSGASINLNELGGNLYKARITADKNKFLDLDEALDEQTPEVQESLKRAMGERWNEFKSANAKTAVRQGFIAFSDERVSKLLSDAGIPGSKYLDQASRGAEGTRNFVVFNDKDVEITHKNGKPVNAEIRENVVDQARGLPPKQPELPLAPETEPMAPKRVVEPGPQPALQTPEDMAKTLTATDHQDAIRADIDRERAMGDFKVPGVDENGSHTMVSVDAALNEVDRYKQVAEQIQACAAPAQEAAE